MTPISLQLYSLRGQAIDDLPGVLKTAAGIGYKGVEFAGLHGCDPKEIASLNQDLGLQVSSSFTDIPTKDTVGRIVDTELILGNRRIVGGFGPNDFNTIDDCKRAAEIFEQAAEMLKPYGMTFSFHNHWFEFKTIDGRLIYDILMEETSGAFGELDVYWAAFAGTDPVEIVKKYKNRLNLLHIKDGPLEGDFMTAVGSGKVNIPAIVEAADTEVLKWLIVELDACQTDMLEAVTQSYRYLVSNGLALGNK